MFCRWVCIYLVLGLWKTLLLFWYFYEKRVDFCVCFWYNRSINKRKEEMLDLINQLNKQKIAMLFDVRNGLSAEDLDKRLGETVEEIYRDGEEMGLSKALNYVENEQDRQRIFEVLSEYQRES